MTVDPVAPPPDDKDWTWVLDELCGQCGFDARAIERSDIAPLLTTSVNTLAAALDQPGARNRPDAQTWSPLEYACHARDVCRIFTARLQLMLTEDDPLFANWDQDETARSDRYWTQEPLTVAEELRAAGAVAAAAFSGIDGTAWDRPGRRSNGSVFTADTLGRYFVHDLVHHAHDVRS